MGGREGSVAGCKRGQERSGQTREEKEDTGAGEWQTVQRIPEGGKKRTGDSREEGGGAGSEGRGGGVARRKEEAQGSEKAAIWGEREKQTLREREGGWGEGQGKEETEGVGEEQGTKGAGHARQGLWEPSRRRWCCERGCRIRYASSVSHSIPLPRPDSGRSRLCFCPPGVTRPLVAG